ncbi:MAG: serine/threonine protein kinase [FCB group bacterium]|nr:serine/threonine protein kinase [FCB group bacterium]
MIGESAENNTVELQTLAVPVVLDYARQLFSGLAAIHQAGIIHRDLKPGNILLDECGRIHILDFSLAYAKEDLRITPHDDIVGTPGYIAPEVIAGAEESISSDLFSAGVILYELLTNRTLFQSKDVFSTLQRVHEAVVPNITKIRADVPPEIKTTIKKLLSKHPIDRYSNTADVLEDLKKAEPEKIDVIPAPQALVRTKKRKISLYTAAILALLLPLTAALIYLKYKSPPMNTEVNYTDSSVDSDSIDKYIAADNFSIAGDKTAYENALYDSVNQVISAAKAVDTGEIVEFALAEKDLTAMPAVSEIISPAEFHIEKKLIVDSSIVKIDRTAIPDSVVVTFAIYPWAKIYCDGNYLGVTPILAEIVLLNRDHQFRFEHPDFPALTKDFIAVNTDTFRIAADLTIEFGRLEFAVVPWSYLIIDDIERGVLPMAKPIFIQSGEHIIRFRHPHFDDIVKTISVTAGETLLVEADFSR